MPRKPRKKANREKPAVKRALELFHEGKLKTGYDKDITVKKEGQAIAIGYAKANASKKKKTKYFKEYEKTGKAYGKRTTPRSASPEY